MDGENFGYKVSYLSDLVLGSIVFHLYSILNV